MRIILITLATLIFAHSSFAGTPIGTDTQKEPDNYVSITEISSGPLEAVETKPDENEKAGEDEVLGRYFRVVVLTSEIYNTVYIEEITQGEEGCCLKIHTIRKINLDEFKKKFGLTGEITGFRVLQWNSSRSFNFEMHDRRFKVNKVGNPVIDITELKIANKSLKRDAVIAAFSFSILPIHRAPHAHR